MEDIPSAWEILFPNPYRELEELEKKLNPPQPWASPDVYWKAARLAWIDYCSTWEGFFSRKSTEADDEELKVRPGSVDMKPVGQKEDESAPSLDDVFRKGEEMAGTFTRNVTFISDKAMTLREEARERTGIRTIDDVKRITGIYSIDDLKRIAAEWMRLAADCLQEFLVGYRQGRDEEVDRMLNEYLTEEEKKHDHGKGQSGESTTKTTKAATDESTTKTTEAVGEQPPDPQLPETDVANGASPIEASTCATQSKAITRQKRKPKRRIPNALRQLRWSH